MKALVVVIGIAHECSECNRRLRKGEKVLRRIIKAKGSEKAFANAQGNLVQYSCLGCRN